MRLRIFAGPNGSGKSTIINAVRHFKIKGIPVDFGIYVNADDIAKNLRSKYVSFGTYRLKVSREEFEQVVANSGLLSKEFSIEDFQNCYILEKNRIYLQDHLADERLAQIIADYLRKRLLRDRKKFSFETVFSHHSKLDIIKEASEAGYKVYLYFVSTEDPEINVFRVQQVRVKEGGHNVPTNKIVDRYYRSLDFLFEAAQLVYQSYFFDNSYEGKDFQLFAHFKKKTDGTKKWDKIDKDFVPHWFVKYYSSKVLIPKKRKK